MARVMFGLGASLFILGGTLNAHLDKYCVREVKDGTYVDNINIAEETTEKTKEIEKDAVEILDEGGFKLHKWHSNVGELESDATEDGEATYVKESLGTKANGIKLLGLSWNKKEDTLSGTFPVDVTGATKGIVLRTMAKIYDQLGLAAPILLTAKVIFRDICAEMGYRST